MPVLVDTSVWIDFFRQGDAGLRRLLADGAVWTHAIIVGELATGNLPKRRSTLRWLLRLRRTTEATHDENLVFLESRKLYGRGLHYNDIAILASARLEGVPLWTRDKGLAEAAEALGLAFEG